MEITDTEEGARGSEVLYNRSGMGWGEDEELNEQKMRCTFTHSLDGVGHYLKS